MSVETERIAKIKSWLGTGSINIFGLPFSGKDTQARILSDILEAPVIAGGDILRSHPDNDKIKSLMATGKLFPTKFYLEVILPYLSRKDFADQPLILSSVGRWHGEEVTLTEAAKSAGHPIKAVVFLNMSEEIVRQRYLSSHEVGDRGERHDDADHLIDVRLAEFRKKTLPVIEYYRNKGLLIEVDGAAPKDIVANQITDQLLNKI